MSQHKPVSAPNSERPLITHLEEPFDKEEMIKCKMEELRKHSHPNVTDDKLRQGARIALGLK
jgi:hypothetical protein